MASIKKRPNGKWRARYRDGSGKEHARHFERRVDAQRWLDGSTAELVTGTWVEPKARKVTVDQWCDQWITGYGSRRASTVRQARTHLAKIRDEFGPKLLPQVRPSLVRSWCARLHEQGFAASYVNALHRRLSQLMQDAVLDGLIPANPCSRRTSPGAGEQRPYVATTEQVFGLYELFEPRYRIAVLLGAFAGLRTAEACGLRPADVQVAEAGDPPRGAVPGRAAEDGDEPDRSPDRRHACDRSGRACRDLAGRHGADELGRRPGRPLADRPRDAPGAWRDRRPTRRVPVPRPSALLRIATYRVWADVKVVQHRLRHASAKTTLDTYGHLWPDSDESTRTAVERVLSARLAGLADSVRTGGTP
jgi:integrase